MADTTFFDSLPGPVQQMQGYKDLLDYKTAMLSEEELFFDPENYRYALAGEKDTAAGVANVGSQEWLYDKLISDKDHAETAEGIRQTRGSYDEILVVAQKIASVMCPVVIEGNRTLAVYRKYRQAGVAGFAQIRCRVFRSLTLRQKRMLLAIKHVKGKKRWGSYNDARYLSDMVDDNVPIESLAKHLGKRVKFLEEYLAAYQLHDRIQHDHDTYDSNFFTICLRFAQSTVLSAEYAKSPNGKIYKWFSECVANKRFNYTGRLDSTQLADIARTESLRIAVLENGVDSIRHLLEAKRLKGKAEEIIKKLEHIPDMLQDVPVSDCDRIRDDEELRMKYLQVISNAQVAMNNFVPFIVSAQPKGPGQSKTASGAPAVVTPITKANQPAV